MKNPEQVKRDGAMKYGMTYKLWVDRTIEALNEVIDKKSMEFYLTGEIYLGTRLPIPIMESGTFSERIEVQRKTEELVKLRVQMFGWKIKERTYGGSRVQYYLVKKG